MVKSTDKYGTALFEELVDHLWKKRRLLDNPEYCFGDPDYADLPGRIVGQLNSDAVDAIWWAFRPENAELFTRKKRLETTLLNGLFLLAGGRADD